MEVKKCDNCGANLEFVRQKNYWICPYCDTKYAFDADNRTQHPEECCGLNSGLFEFEKDLVKATGKRHTKDCINTMAYCMRSFDTGKEVEEYIYQKLTFPDDISAKGIREERIDKVRSLFEREMDPDEHVIVYGNKGLFSQGKEFYVVTDKRCIFVNRKKCQSVLHKNIASLKLQEDANYSNWYVNDDYEKGIISVGNPEYQGALIAMICLLSYEQDPDREKIRIV
ncbi:MAG: hypothetical protein E7294_14570 [Lachnospiraceae bacterium]|nr:hypothetical protein [Lachnospiraceae bacterium]